MVDLMKKYGERFSNWFNTRLGRKQYFFYAGFFNVCLTMLISDIQHKISFVLVNVFVYVGLYYYFNKLVPPKPQKINQDISNRKVVI